MTTTDSDQTKPFHEIFLTFFFYLLVKINFVFLILTKNKAVLLITKTQLHFDQQRRNVLVVLRPGYTHTLEGLASTRNMVL